MDSIEKGLIDIDEHTKNAINKHNELFAKTLYNTANKSNKSSNRLDMNYKKIFTELNTIGKLDSDAFNPDTVVEFRDGKSYQVIESWDKIDGILPNRKVMGVYYVDKTIDITPGLIFDTYSNKVISANPYSHNQYKSSHDSRQFTFDGDNKITKFGDIFNHNNNIYNRNEIRKEILRPLETKVFEVDNYLNLYHKETGLYLMFHKTSFPDICFYLAREYTQLPEMNNKSQPEYYTIYLSKRLNNINVIFDKNNYHSEDNRIKFLESLNELVPDTYHRIYKLYNNFRKMQTFEVNNEIQVDTSNEKIDILDTKDRLITALREKLNTTIIRCEKSEEIIGEIMDKFNNKSNKILELEREKVLLEDKINKIKNENNLVHISKMEEKEKELIELYKRLSESEVFKAKCESIGMSMETLTKNLEIESLEKSKIKDMNVSLINKVRSEKERNEKMKNDNDELLKQIRVYNNNLENSANKIEDLTKKINEKNEECKMLSDKLVLKGDMSNDVLENALSDRITDLEKQLEKVIESKNELENENKRINQKNEKIINMISNLKI